jgi:hypothetical protein
MARDSSVGIVIRHLSRMTGVFRVLSQKRLRCFCSHCIQTGYPMVGARGSFFCFKEPHCAIDQSPPYVARS